MGMTEQTLDPNALLYAELFALKITLTILTVDFLSRQSDPAKAADFLSESVATSIDTFRLRNTPEPKLTMIKEAMKERAISLVSNAANARLAPRDRQS
jgi:hypothetical protein